MELAACLVILGDVLKKIVFLKGLVKFGDLM